MHTPISLSALSTGLEGPPHPTHPPLLHHHSLLVGFWPFNCHLNKVHRHNQRPGSLSVCSLSSKPPSKYDLVHFFCLTRRPWSTLGGRAWGNTKIWFEILSATKFQILVLSALVTKLRCQIVLWKLLQWPSQHLLLSDIDTRLTNIAAEVRSTLFG